MKKIRLFTNVLVVATMVLFIGCTETEDEKQQTPAPTVQSTATTEHEIVATVREFVKAIDDGEYDHAIGLSTPNEFKREGLVEVNGAFDLAKTEIAEAFAGYENAAVLANPIPGPSGTVQFGYSLTRNGDHWLIRDVDMLPNNDAVEKWLAGFKGVEPNAKRVAGED